MTKKKKKSSLKKFLFKSFYLKEQQEFYEKHCNTKFLIPILIIVILIFLSLIVLQSMYIYFDPDFLY